MVSVFPELVPESPPESENGGRIGEIGMYLPGLPSHHILSGSEKEPKS